MKQFTAAVMPSSSAAIFSSEAKVPLRVLYGDSRLLETGEPGA